MAADYVTRTILGTLRGTWKGLKMKNKLQDLPVAVNLGLCNYFNLVYKALIRKDDEVVLQDFAQIHAASAKPHSEICLLVVFQKYAAMQLLKIQWGLLTTCDNVDFASMCFLNQWERLHTKEVFDSLLSHDCTGDNIKNCDPEKPLFIISDTPITKEQGYAYCANPNCCVEGKFTCHRCKSVRYCSRSHQAAHWAVHKQTCVPSEQVKT